MMNFMWRVWGVQVSSVGMRDILHLNQPKFLSIHKILMKNRKMSRNNMKNVSISVLEC